MPALILTRREVASLLNLGECIVAVEEAFRAHGSGDAPIPGVLGVHVASGAFHIKAAAMMRPRAYFAAKVNGNFPGNRERYARPTIQGLIVLADLETGTPLAVMDSIEITIQRTGAATAVAAKHLARTVASTVTIVGCGVQGRVQLRSIAAVREVAAIHAYDSNLELASGFAREMAPVVGVPIDPVNDLRQALRQSDIVVTCTTSRSPIVFRGDLKPGAFVAAVGADNPEKNEIAPEVLADATVVPDVIDQALVMGDLHHAVTSGAMRREDVNAELGEVVAGRKPGRRTNDEIVVFDSTGMALQDVAAAALVYERARERRIGRLIAINENAPRQSRFLSAMSSLHHRL